MANITSLHDRWSRAKGQMPSWHASTGLIHTQTPLAGGIKVSKHFMILLDSPEEKLSSMNKFIAYEGKKWMN